MKKFLLLAVVCLTMLSVTGTLHAQTGCTDSPENPTAVLALVGSAGAFLASARRRLKAGRSTDKK